MSHQGAALQFASDRLKDDDQVVLTAIRAAPWALRCASGKLQANREFVLRAVRD